MRSAVPLFRTPAAPWAMMRSPRRTAAAMPKRTPPLPSIACRLASTLTGALSSIFLSDRPADPMFRIVTLHLFYSAQKTGLELCERRIFFSDGQVVLKWNFFIRHLYNSTEMVGVYRLL